MGALDFSGSPAGYQMKFIGNRCRKSSQVQSDGMVRLPGVQACSNIANAKQEGVAMLDATMDKLQACAMKLGIEAIEPSY